MIQIDNSTPQRVTIIRADTNWFHVITDRYGEIGHAELAFDEMLGALARMFCPTLSSGEPNRFWCKPLFLSPPEPPHPDAAGDKAPTFNQEPRS